MVWYGLIQKNLVFLQHCPSVTVATSYTNLAPSVPGYAVGGLVDTRILVCTGLLMLSDHNNQAHVADDHQTVHKGHERLHGGLRTSHITHRINYAVH